MQQKNVHYFPGHMKKAQESLSNYVKPADLIVEVLDARAPISSRNPAFEKMIGEKPHLLVFSKEDRADPELTKAWIAHYEKLGIIAFAGDLKKSKIFKLLQKKSEPLVLKKRQKEARLGMKKQPLRLLIAGIPNVGKSTLINNLAGRTVVKAENRPGVTRAEQWIRLSEDFVLLDTPGILPMNYPDHEQAVKLALLGSIKEDVLPIDDLAKSLLGYLKPNYPHSLNERYGVDAISSLEDDEILSKIALRRGFLSKEGNPDLQKAALTLIRDYQNGLLGQISLERPEC